MHTSLKTLIYTLLSAQLVFAAAVALPSPSPPKLNLTAISAHNGESTLACWQLDNPFTQSNVPGTVGSKSLSLGDIGNSTLSVLPPHFDGGFHNAPTLQYVSPAWNLSLSVEPQNILNLTDPCPRYVVFTAGLARVSLYKGSDEVYVQGGKYGVVIAADTADVSKHGHRTEYLSGANTIALQLPVASISHKVLHNGPCKFSELTGI